MDRPPRLLHFSGGSTAASPFESARDKSNGQSRSAYSKRQLHLRFVKTRLRPMAIPGGCAAKQSLCHRLPQFASDAVELPRHSRFVLAQCASDLRQGELVHVIARQEHAFARRQPTEGSRERTIEPGEIPLAVRIGLLGIRAPRQRMRAPFFSPEFRRGASRELVGCLTFFGFERNRPPARSQQVHMPLGKHGPEPCGKLAPAVKIFKQGFSPSASGRTDAVEFRVERVRQLLRAGLIPGPRGAQNGAGGGAQFMPEMLDKTFPGPLPGPPRTRTPGLNLPGATTSGKLRPRQPRRAHRHIVFSRAAPEGLCKAIAGQAPSRALRLRVEPLDQTRILRTKSVERRDSGFLCHVVRTAFRCLDAS